MKGSVDLGELLCVHMCSHLHTFPAEVRDCCPRLEPCPAPAVLLVAGHHILSYTLTSCPGPGGWLRVLWGLLARRGGLFQRNCQFILVFSGATSLHYAVSVPVGTVSCWRRLQRGFLAGCPCPLLLPGCFRHSGCSSWPGPAACGWEVVAGGHPDHSWL